MNRAKVFKFCIHLHRVEVYCVKEINNAEIHFAIFSPFLYLSLQFNIFCVKHFSGTTAPRILKFYTYIGYDLLNFVKKNES